MKKIYFSEDHFIKRICFLLLLFPVAVLLIWGFLIPAQFEETYLGELKQKEKRLEETEGKRIVVIGGSAVAFGIDTRLLQDELPEYTTVNFGLYAALGTKVMIDLAAKDLREGDLVILMPEQQEQTLSLYFNGKYLWEAFDGNFTALTRIKKENFGAMIATFPEFAADKFRCLVSGQMPKGSGVYRKSAFDENGDMDPALVSGNVMAEQYDPTMMVDFSEGLPDEDMLDYINAFTEEMEIRGVRVLYHLCPVNEKSVEKGADPSAYYEWLRNQLNSTLLGNPTDSIMEAEMFYDTNFHLNGTGKIYFTRQLVKELKAELGITGQTASAETYLKKQKDEIRELTANKETEEIGDSRRNSESEIYNRSSEDFIWEENQYGCVITGLTAEGIKESELFLPDTLNGSPVVRIEKGAFSESKELEEVTIADGVAAIADGAFDSCSSLNKIIFLSEEPENCQVGQNLLKGCHAVICVPKGSLSAYKRSYWWSVYADRMEEYS